MAESQEKAPRGPGLVVRLSADEREAWHAAARADGYRQTARWVREVVQEHLTRTPMPRRRVPSVPVEVLAQLGKIGSNVNQLAHRANAAALHSEPFPVIEQELEAVRRELAAVRAALTAPAVAPEPEPEPVLRPGDPGYRWTGFESAEDFARYGQR